MDDETVEEMRAPRKAAAPVRVFMAAKELKLLRTTVIKTTQERLAQQLIRPENGVPVTKGAIHQWEQGLRAIPLWAARRVRELAEAARQYDAKREMR